MHHFLRVFYAGAIVVLGACSAGDDTPQAEVATSEDGDPSSFDVRGTEASPPTQNAESLAVVRADVGGTRTFASPLDAATREKISAVCEDQPIAVLDEDGAVSCHADQGLAEIGALEVPKTNTLVNGQTANVMSGTYYLSISALTCMPQTGGTFAENCGGGGTVRTEGNSNFPCTVYGRAQRDTYICDLPLPSGAVVEEIIAYGYDWSSSGYMEAAVLRSPNTSFGVEYFGNYGGNWQNSGIPFAGGTMSFPIFNGLHAVSAGHKYTIMLGLRNPDASTVVMAYGFRVRYTI